MKTKTATLSKNEIIKLVSFAANLCKSAGLILRTEFQKSQKVRFKGRINPVTQADLKSEKFIKNKIMSHFPEHSILAEESGVSNTKDASLYCWIIDPLDGTVNFFHGFPVYCVSIACEYNGVVVAGAVYDPERNELFRAGQGLGAYLNDKRIEVSSQSSLEKSLLATGFGYNIKTARRNNLGYFAKMAKKVQGIRRAGSAALDLCWLACGRFDGYWELHLSPWDTEAGAMIVNESGGRLNRINGKAHSIYHHDILASNSRIHEQMQKALKTNR